MRRSLHADLRPRPQGQGAFTLIELMVVLALLAIMAALVTPRMVDFFRGRALSQEARRILALTHQAQDRAIAEGVPVVVWFDPTNATYGQNIQTGFVTNDDRASSFTVQSSLTLEVSTNETAYDSELGDERLGFTEGLPMILFSPDGFFDFGSVATLIIRQDTTAALKLVPTANRLGYEILPYALN